MGNGNVRVIHRDGPARLGEGLGPFQRSLLGKPDVIDPQGRCSVCGRWANNRHHVVPKGIGGATEELDRLIPRILLCGAGNASGCHAKVHGEHTLHFAWDESRGGWLYLVTDEPMADWRAWDEHREEYRLLPAWEHMGRSSS